MSEAAKWAWDYAVTVFWGWAGIALAIIAIVDLVERALEKKVTLSGRNKVVVGVGILLVAQAQAYWDLTRERNRAQAELVAIRQKLVALENQPKASPQADRGSVKANRAW